MTYFVLSGTWNDNSVKLHSMQCNGQASVHPTGRFAAEHPMATRYWLIAVGTVLQAPAVSSKCRVDSRQRRLSRLGYYIFLYFPLFSDGLLFRTWGPQLYCSSELSEHPWIRPWSLCDMSLSCYWCCHNLILLCTCCLCVCMLLNAEPFSCCWW